MRRRHLLRREEPKFDRVAHFPRLGAVQEHGAHYGLLDGLGNHGRPEREAVLMVKLAVRDLDLFPDLFSLLALDFITSLVKFSKLGFGFYSDFGKSAANPEKFDEIWPKSDLVSDKLDK